MAKLILIADDTASNLLLLHHVLTGYGYEVIEAVNWKIVIV